MLSGLCQEATALPIMLEPGPNAQGNDRAPEPSECLIAPNCYVESK